MIRKAAMLLLGMALVVSTVYADPTARVTGGGKLQPGVNVAFSLTCDGSGANNLVFKWDAGNFHLDAITPGSASCTSNSGVYTYSSTGTGTVNGVPGATVTIEITQDTKGGNSQVGVSWYDGLNDITGAGGYLNGITFHNE